MWGDPRSAVLLSTQDLSIEGKFSRGALFTCLSAGNTLLACVEECDKLYCEVKFDSISEFLVFDDKAIWSDLLSPLPANNTGLRLNSSTLDASLNTDLSPRLYLSGALYHKRLYNMYDPDIRPLAICALSWYLTAKQSSRLAANRRSLGREFQIHAAAAAIRAWYRNKSYTHASTGHCLMRCLCRPPPRLQVQSHQVKKVRIGA